MPSVRLFGSDSADSDDPLAAADPWARASQVQLGCYREVIAAIFKGLAEVVRVGRSSLLPRRPSHGPSSSPPLLARRKAAPQRPPPPSVYTRVFFLGVPSSSTPRSSTPVALLGCRVREAILIWLGVCVTRENRSRAATIPDPSLGLDLPQALDDFALPFAGAGSRGSSGSDDDANEGLDRFYIG